MDRNGPDEGTDVQLIAAPMWEFGADQGVRQFAELGVALVLSTLIGLERAVQQKSAGLRTHTLVGVGSALFMQVSQYGFSDVLLRDHVSLDPSRVAAQIVSGIGFIGGGLIFVRRDAVRGLTTAATVWLTCAVGMACGGGLALLATAATVVHFLVIRGYPLFTRRLPALWSAERVELQLSYRVGTGLLPRVLELCTAAGYKVGRVRVDRAPWKGRDRTTRVVRAEEEARPTDTGVAEVQLALEGTGDVLRLVGEISELEGVLGADAGRDLDSSD
ncbi:MULTISPECIES: MgtC/SapB family protein [Streptomyces]|uniref:Magnesium transporter YhiD n=4 Tax=Streptomyces TaxID=1883 RepID=A0A2J7YUQ0_STRMQ|nr:MULTISPECIES: MgtC/SapB family protein [Streptomyces]MYU16863.1 MgtC/SapB family protein [Streptomyces sp. SID8361]AQA15001.1 magnesium transporter MgtC [Streptomyces autolyticus]MCC4315891.1 MgtC/SapB family protein [Streptomyces malaysiensis]MCD9587767.1 MgtC/SapB family protein [Streptomyces sp. 8ZJF_21]PNG91751.1 magnesium transporter YhiD [Streptomyces malaysiensis]